MLKFRVEARLPALLRSLIMVYLTTRTKSAPSHVRPIRPELALDGHPTAEISISEQLTIATQNMNSIRWNINYSVTQLITGPS